MDKYEVWDYMSERLGLFLIAIRFDLNVDKVQIANRSRNKLQLFNLMCMPKPLKNPAFFEEPVFLDKVEITKSKMLNVDGSWNFSNIFDYIREKERDGVLPGPGTPFSIIDKMISRATMEDLLLRNNIELIHILDNSCGRGRFLYIAKQRLLYEGFDETEVIKYLYGIDIDIRSAFITAAVIDPTNLYPRSNIYCGNPIDNSVLRKKDMKFDFIIGNYPFNDDKQRKPGGPTGMRGKNLWPEFAKLALNKVSEGGYIAVIHPGSWRKPDHPLLKELTSLDIKHIAIHGLSEGQKYFNVSTGFDYYVVQNKQPGGVTEVRDINGQVQTLDLAGRKFIPNTSFELLDKITAGEKDDRCEVIFSYSKYETRKKWMSRAKTDHFRYPCVYGITLNEGPKLWYSSTRANGHFNTPKIIIPLSKYTDVLIDDGGDYGICQFAFGIKTSNPEESKRMAAALKCDAFQQVWDAIEWIYNGKEWRVFKYIKRDFWKEFLEG